MRRCRVVVPLHDMHNDPWWPRDRRPRRRFKLGCVIGLFLPSLLAPAFSGATASIPEPATVTIGRRYSVSVVAEEVKYHCRDGGCSAGSGTRYNQAFEGEIEVSLRFTPTGSSKAIEPIPYTMGRGYFVPPADGVLELSGRSLTAEQLESLSKPTSECNKLTIESVTLGPLHLEPYEGEP